MQPKVPIKLKFHFAIVFQGIPSTNAQWDVLKPAILQPPQAPMGRLVEKTDAGDVLEDEHKADIEV